MNKAVWLFVSVAAITACNANAKRSPIGTAEESATKGDGKEERPAADPAAPLATTTTPPPPPGAAASAFAGTVDMPADDNIARAKSGAGTGGGGSGASHAYAAKPAPMQAGAQMDKDGVPAEARMRGGLVATTPPMAIANGAPAPTQGPGNAFGASGERQAPAAVLDRNARYATTYRPGGAALAAFDAAVTKGSIPTTYRDLVGDFGGRYAPSLTVPAGAAMAFQVEEDRAMLSPSGGLVNLRISMKSTDAMPSRAPLSVHLVLDISGSMQGLAIENAKQAAETLVKKLEPQDDFSMVIFLG